MALKATAALAKFNATKILRKNLQFWYFLSLVLLLQYVLVIVQYLCG